MYIKPTKIAPVFIRNGVAIFFFLTLIGITISVNFTTILNPYTYDENLYKKTADNFTTEHIQYIYNNVLETKPLAFLTLQKILNNSDPLFTRGFAYILIILSTLLIYKITNKINKDIILYTLFISILKTLSIIMITKPHIINKAII